MKTWLFVAIALELAIVAIYLISLNVAGTPYPPFDMNGYMTIPSWLQAIQLFAISVIAVVLLVSRVSPPPSKGFLVAIAVFLGYAAIDEVFKVHLKLHRYLPLQSDEWFGIYIGLLVSLLLLGSWDFWRLWRQFPRETAIAAVGLGVFVLGGFLSYWVFQPFGWLDAEPFRIAFEEFLELLGENLVVFGSLQFSIKKLNF
ncbi:hypothetical protein [Baaleninema simplex]|uniref:hypothetical protein n=1 Tax=Baaleninema simplex TaxID=2862350 RepID=UPI00036F4CF5|nr:hypothetical protein [Baaleninema simplex]